MGDLGSGEYSGEFKRKYLAYYREMLEKAKDLGLPGTDGDFVNSLVDFIKNNANWIKDHDYLCLFNFYFKQKTIFSVDGVWARYITEIFNRAYSGEEIFQCLVAETDVHLKVDDIEKLIRTKEGEDFLGWAVLNYSENSKTNLLIRCTNNFGTISKGVPPKVLFPIKKNLEEQLNSPGDLGRLLEYLGKDPRDNGESAIELLDFLLRKSIVPLDSIRSKLLAVIFDKTRDIEMSSDLFDEIDGKYFKSLVLSLALEELTLEAENENIPLSWNLSRHGVAILPELIEDKEKSLKILEDYKQGFFRYKMEDGEILEIELQEKASQDE